MQHRYNIKTTLHHLTAATLVVSAVLITTMMPVRAQQDTGSGAQPQQAAPAGLEEIIVTARKRQESILNVPVVEIAIPRAQLEVTQTISVDDLVDLVPGLVVGHAIGSLGALLSIRGVGTLEANQGVESSVSLNLDGMSIGTGLAFETGLFDLDQVEVLKGPQSLFFGKSSTGGVISLRSADPTDKFELIGESSYEFEARTSRDVVIVSGPVTDTLKLRLASMYSDSKGYFYENGVAVPGTGALDPPFSRGPNVTDYMLRGTALWSPADQFDARLKVNFSDNRSLLNFTNEEVGCPEGAGFAPSGIPFIGGTNCTLSRYLTQVGMDPANFPGVPNSGIPYNQANQTYGTLELNYRPPIHGLTLTSVTGFYSLSDQNLTNASGSTAAGTTLDLNDNLHRRDFTEEFRLQSDFSTPLNFMLGGLYEDGQFHDRAVVGGNSAYRLPPVLSFADITINVKSYSAFGQLRYTITPAMELAAGLRWTDETRNEIPLNGSTTPETLDPVATPRIKSDKVAPEVTLTYKPTDDVTLFTAYKVAYKSGSFSMGSLPLPGTDNSFGDEKAQGGEGGMKSRWLDRQLTVELAGYYYDYKGLQVGNQATLPGGLTVIRVVNAGAARTYGLDLDAAFRPQTIDGLTFHGAAEWDKARYQVLNNLPCFGGQTIAMGCNQLFNAQTGLYTAENLAGTQMLRAPEWQGNLGLEYELPVGANHKMVLSSSAAYSSKYPTALLVNYYHNDNYQTAYAKVDLGVSLQSRDNRWEISLIGKNLNNKIIEGICQNSNVANGLVFGGQITGGTKSGPAGLDELGCTVEPGREVWLRVILRPFG